MFVLLEVILCIAVAVKVADLENRSGLLWGLIAFAIMVGSGIVGLPMLFAPLIGLIGVVVVMTTMKILSQR